MRLALALILFAAALGVWGTAGFVTRRQVSPGFRSSYLLMIALTGLQGAIGLILLTMAHPRELLHVVYGGVPLPVPPRAPFWRARGARARRVPGARPPSGVVAT